MDAAHVRITPYIGEEIVSFTDDVYIGKICRDSDNGRWLEYVSALNRITSGTVTIDDPIITKIIDAIWEDPMTRYSASSVAVYLSYAISHGYRPIWNKFVDTKDKERRKILSKIEVTKFYEQYWDFYIEVSQALSGHSGRFLAKLYKAAVIGGFDRLYDSDLSRNPILLYTAIEYYTVGNAKLERLIRKCIKEGIADFAHIVKLLWTKNFNDVILETVRTLPPDHQKCVYDHAIANEQHELAESIMSIMSGK